MTRADAGRTLQTPPERADGLVDLTDDTAIEFGDMAIATGRREITVAVRIRSGSRRRIVAPLHLEIADVESKLGPVRAAGSNGSGNAASVWDFSDALPPGGLRGGHATGDKTIAFRFTGDTVPAIERGTGEVLTMSFRVRGRLDLRE